MFCWSGWNTLGYMNQITVPLPACDDYCLFSIPARVVRHDLSMWSDVLRRQLGQLVRLCMDPPKWLHVLQEHYVYIQSHINLSSTTLNLAAQRCLVTHKNRLLWSTWPRWQAINLLSDRWVKGKHFPKWNLYILRLHIYKGKLLKFRSNNTMQAM